MGKFSNSGQINSTFTAKVELKAKKNASHGFETVSKEEIKKMRPKSMKAMGFATV